MNVASADSGTERKTAAVARMLPRKTRIISPVSTRPIAPSCSRFSIEVLTNTDWSKITDVTSDLGMSSRLAYGTLDPFHHRDRIDVSALLEYRQIDRTLTVHTHDAGLDL